MIPPHLQLCQAHYVGIRVNAFKKRYNDIPIVWCGDFNSQPRGYVHRYLTEGVVNAKSAESKRFYKSIESSVKEEEEEKVFVMIYIRGKSQNKYIIRTILCFHKYIYLAEQLINTQGSI